MEPTAGSLAVTRHPTLRDQIASTLRRAIMNLELKPGELLVERDLTERTGASRPSVREALRQLEAEGLIESRNGRGTYVRAIELPEAMNVYEVRAELEGLGARLFCERATDVERDAVSSAVGVLSAAIGEGANSRTILDAQAAFYQAMFAGARNPVLERTVQGLQVRVSQLRALTLAVPGRDRASLLEFEALHAALVSGDAASAERAAIEHVQSAAAAMAAQHGAATE